MISRPFSHDPLTGTTTTFHYDDNGVVTIETQQDVTELVEHNKSSLASIDERARWGEMTRVASIPLPIYVELREKGILRDQKAFKAWLNDPANRFFRTRPGRV